MNPTRAHETVSRASRERGYSMIELSVAVVIALFLLNGTFMILQNTRMASNDQNALAQLQDEERMAMTMITDVVQQAGYYPNAQTTDATIALPASETFTTVGQAVYGAPDQLYGETVSVRYQGDATNSVLDCRGTVIGNTGVPAEMTFSVRANPNKDGSWLYCTVNGADYPLIPNVTSLAVLYGVDTNSSGSVNAYLPSNQMAGLWNNVFSVKITVNFGNPLAGQAGQQLQQILSFTRVISVQAKTGYNVLNFY
jgi:type IV pilus assembly protein PilW